MIAAEPADAIAPIMADRASIEKHPAYVQLRDVLEDAPRDRAMSNVDDFIVEKKRGASEKEIEAVERATGYCFGQQLRSLLMVMPPVSYGPAATETTGAHAPAPKRCVAGWGRRRSHRARR